MMGGKNWRDIMYRVQIGDIWCVGSTNSHYFIVIKIFFLDVQVFQVTNGRHAIMKFAAFYSFSRSSVIIDL